MSTSRSVLKSQRQEVKRTARNRAIRSEVKSSIKNAKTSIFENSSDYALSLAEALKKIDKACTKGVLHKNNAARKKSRLNKLAKKLTAQIKDS
ncbi:MAG: 30S ribosomal protein S20 [Candidatus Ratteibacteria bacterium]|jgi:small subunit ribosomal protein S20